MLDRKKTMLRIILTKSAPAAGKSTWAIAQVAKDPTNWVRINNDLLRSMCNGSVYSKDFEKFISETRSFMIKQAISNGMNIIVDNVNADKRHFEEACRIAKSSGKDVEVSEMPFYEELDVLIARDKLREGVACVGEEVIKNFWKKLGGKQFKNYKPKTMTFSKSESKEMVPMIQDEAKPRAVIFDNDGTISLLNGRNPYDASTCDNDLPCAHVIECMRLYFNAGYKVIFVSGREDKDRAPTERFYAKHFPEVEYQLFMRKTGDTRKDFIIKEEIFNENIKNKYYVAGWFDDRLQVSKWVYDSGLPLFRVNDPTATF